MKRLFILSASNYDEQYKQIKNSITSIGEEDLLVLYRLSWSKMTTMIPRTLTNRTNTKNVLISGNEESEEYIEDALRRKIDEWFQNYEYEDTKKIDVYIIGTLSSFLYSNNNFIKYCRRFNKIGWFKDFIVDPDQLKSTKDVSKRIKEQKGVTIDKPKQTSVDLGMMMMGGVAEGTKKDDTKKKEEKPVAKYEPYEEKDSNTDDIEESVPDNLKAEYEDIDIPDNIAYEDIPDIPDDIDIPDSIDIPDDIDIPDISGPEEIKEENKKKEDDSVEKSEKKEDKTNKEVNKKPKFDKNALKDKPSKIKRSIDAQKEEKKDDSVLNLQQEMSDAKKRKSEKEIQEAEKKKEAFKKKLEAQAAKGSTPAKGGRSISVDANKPKKASKEEIKKIRAHLFGASAPSEGINIIEQTEVEKNRAKWIASLFKEFASDLKKMLLLNNITIELTSADVQSVIILLLKSTDSDDFNASWGTQHASDKIIDLSDYQYNVLKAKALNYNQAVGIGYKSGVWDN